MNLKPEYLLKGGEYRVEHVLGTGGFGITYLAEQVSLGRKVAIKEFFMREYCERVPGSTAITLGSSGSRELVERFRDKFLKEARSIASLEHKNIVPIIDVFEENGTAYYVMKYVGGGSLGDKVKGTALPEVDAVRYIRQVASALDYVHSRRMMHLDVKPANVLLSDDNDAVLIDFGLAKQYDDAGTQTSSTPVGISHGYAPMEQYKRGGVGTFSPATDIYSLGATLYKLVTGLTPPDANDVANDGLPELPQHLSSNVRAAIEAAMQFRLKDRPQSIGEFLALLECHSEQSEESPKNANKEILPPSGRQNDNRGKRKDESGKVKDESDCVEDCPPVLRGTSAAEGVNDSLATDDGETVVGNSSGSCHPERSEPSVDARRGQSQGTYKNANKEILPPSGRQNDNSGKRKDESGKVKDESGKRDGVDDCPPALRGTSAAEGVNDPPATDDGETVVGNSSGSCHPERSEGTYKHANKEILPPSGRQNDNSGEVRDESGELRGERKGLGGSSKKKWAIIIAVLIIGAAAALLGTLSGGGSDDTAAERERLAAIAEEQRIEAERLAAEQQRLEQERLAQEAAEQQRLERERKAKEEAERKAAAEAAEKQRLEQERLAAERKAAEQKRKEEERKRQEAAQTRGTINGHDYVDLGLSVKWATCNVGASSPEGYGNYYAWGETTTKSSYTEENSTTYGKQMSSIAGNPTWDAARKNWGSPWRLPTEAEFQELIDNCTWEWTTRNGHNGYKVTSKKNGNSIFLPAAGWRYGASSNYQGSLGHYWSATPSGSGTGNAYGLNFGEGGRYTSWYYRFNGFSVRPVSQN